MAKKKKLDFNFAWGRTAFLSLLFVVLMVATGYLGYSYLTQSPYFSVTTIVIDPSLQFIQSKDLTKYHGRNIFRVDLSRLQNDLELKYPQIADLRVVRKYPNQLHLLAKKRVPCAQVYIKNNYVVIDERGVVLAVYDSLTKDLPLIEGVYEDFDYRLGLPLQHINIGIALGLVRNYLKASAWGDYEIEKIDINKTSKIIVYFSKNLQVYFDESRIDYKMKILNVILSQGQIDMKTVKYIDLRFKEPIIGKK